MGRGTSPYVSSVTLLDYCTKVPWTNRLSCTELLPVILQSAIFIFTDSFLDFFIHIQLISDKSPVI